MIRCRLAVIPSQAGCAQTVDVETGEVIENIELLKTWAALYPHLRPCPKTGKWINRSWCVGNKKRKACEYAYDDQKEKKA